jgi:outer membrane murein-binding lipoprotein Lpp
MATYDHKQVLSDYANGRITPEMAVGHSLQHIDKLYEAVNATNASRSTWQAKIDALETRVNMLQTMVDRLTALIAKIRPKQKQASSSQLKPD